MGLFSTHGQDAHATGYSNHCILLLDADVGKQENPLCIMTATTAADPKAATTRQADQVTPEFEAAIDEIVTHYPVSKRSASLPLLHYYMKP